MPDFITGYLSSNKTPGEYGSVFWSLVYIFLIFLGLSVAVIAMNWLERKILAHMQVRLGPMRVGPHGLLQPIADAVKLLIKEDITPSAADRWVFWIAPVFVVITAFTVFIVVPFGPQHAVTDMNIGILFMLVTGAIRLALGANLEAESANYTIHPEQTNLMGLAFVFRQAKLNGAFADAKPLSNASDSSAGPMKRSPVGVRSVRSFARVWSCVGRSK